MSRTPKRTAPSPAKEECVSHRAEAVMFYMTCNAATCLECLDGPRHVDHRLLSISNARASLEKQYSQSWEILRDKLNNLGVQELVTYIEVQMPLQNMLASFIEQVHLVERRMHRAIEEFARDLVTKMLQFAQTQQTLCENKVLGIALEKQELQQMQQKLAHISLNGSIAASGQRIKEVGEILNEKREGLPVPTFQTRETQLPERGGESPNIKRMRMGGLSSSSSCSTIGTASSNSNCSNSGISYFLSNRKLTWKFAKLINQRWAIAQNELESNSCLLKTFVRNYISDDLSSSLFARPNESRYLKCYFTL